MLLTILFLILAVFGLALFGLLVPVLLLALWVIDTILGAVIFVILMPIAIVVALRHNPYK